MKDKRQKTYFRFQMILSIIILVFNFSSCRNIITTPELEQHFTEKQVKDLNEINTFFIKEVLKNDDYKQGIENLYKTLYSVGLYTLLKDINYQKQKKLYNSIAELTFNEIWEVKINSYEDFEDEEYILPKYKGKFQIFLKHLGKTNLFAADCFKHMEESGSFNMLFFNSYLNSNFDDLNFDDFNNQLIISIYLLSMIDDNERDEKTKKRIQENNRRVIKFMN